MSAAGLAQRAFGLFDRLINACAWLGGAILAFALVVALVEVVSRYFFKSPIPGSVELTEYCLLWMTFLAAPWVLRCGGHVTIDLVVETLAPAVRRRLDVAMSGIGAVICAVYAWNTAASVIEFYERELIIRHLWEVPQYIPYIAIPVGTALLTIEFIRRALGQRAGAPPASIAAPPV